MARTSKPNVIRVTGDCAYIQLTGGLEAVVDLDDLPLVSGRSWHADKKARTTYVASYNRTAGGRDLALHRVILSAPVGMVVDHIDGDGLNNRRSNIRLCTHKENLRSAGKRRIKAVDAKGVSKNGESFVSTIQADGKTYHLGSYDTVEEAGAAYLGAARVLFGAFARPG